MRASLLALVCLTAASCQTTPEKVVQTKLVGVPVKEYVSVPPELTKDCRDVNKAVQSVDEAVRLANARKAALDECTSRMRKIRELGN